MSRAFASSAGGGGGLSVFDWTTTEQTYPHWTYRGAVVYAKLVAATLPNATSTFTNHSITNLDLVLDYWGEFSDGTNARKIPYISSSITSSIDMFVNKTQFRLNTATDWSAYSGHIFLLYTKTA